MIKQIHAVLVQISNREALYLHLNVVLKIYV